MALVTILSPAEQVALHLEMELLRGAWKGEMPGAPILSRELGLDPKTVDAALMLLQGRGLLVSQGVGRRRLIQMPKRLIEGAMPLMRVGILLIDDTARRVGYLGELQHGIVQSGHHAWFSAKTLKDFGNDLQRLRKWVKAEDADAWVVIAGGQQVLQWFSSQPLPCFALFGRYHGLPIAGTRPDKLPAYQAVVDRLVALGHRRIALIARGVRRLPTPGRVEVAFLERLESHGIRTGGFHLPDWEDDEAGFHTMLEKLFRVTPPTALLIQEAFLFSAAYHFLARRKLRVPEDVSLVCTDADASFAWCEPPVAHIAWDSSPVVRRVVKWVTKIAHGKIEHNQRYTPAQFMEGGTIAAAPRS
jgi:DNA-binding LacI/PurR family transcriptional regulator